MIRSLIRAHITQAVVIFWVCRYELIPKPHSYLMSESEAIASVATLLNFSVHLYNKIMNFRCVLCQHIYQLHTAGEWICKGIKMDSLIRDPLVIRCRSYVLYQSSCSASHLCPRLLSMQLCVLMYCCIYVGMCHLYRANGSSSTDHVCAPGRW